MLRMQEIAFPGFKFETFSGGVCPQIHAWYVVRGKIRPVRPCGSLSPTICSNQRSRTSEGPLTVKETCPKHQLEIHHKKRYINWEEI
jgi:hypothetical protein